MKKLEQERRFLIKLPLSADAERILSHATPIEITQTYLLPEEGSNVVERVRSSTIKMWKSAFQHFNHTKKIFVSVGVNEEEENVLSENNYYLFVQAADPARFPVEKTRYILPWDQKEFELDIFHGANDGLAILEIELPDIKDNVILPPYLEVLKEITEDKKYSNYNLAKKK